MVDVVARSSKGLLTLAGIGFAIITLGFIYFMGIGGSSDRLFYGLDYGILTVFGFYLILIGLFPVLSTVDARGKKSIKNIYVHLIFIAAVGALMLIYSVLVPQPLTLLDPRHSWKDYFAFGSIMLVLALSLILFSVEDRERLWKFKFLFFLVLLAGLILEILSVLANFSFLESFGMGREWWMVFSFFGGTVFFIGLLPLLLTSGQGFRDFLYTLRIIWLLMVLIGLIIYFVPTLILNDFLLPIETFDTIPYFLFLALGSFLILFGLMFFVSSDQIQGFVHKFRFFSFLIFLLGIIQVIIAAVWALSSSPQIDELYREVLSLTITSTDTSILGLGMTWDIYYINGLVTTLIALTFICSNLYFKSEEFGVAEDVIPSVGKVPVKDATATEMITYLHILGQSNKAMIGKFKDAARKDQFRPRVYEKLVKVHQNQMQLIKSRIENLQKRAPAGAKELFDEVLLDETPVEVTPAAAVAEKVPPAPSPTRSSAPPVPPPTSASVLPPTSAPVPPPTSAPVPPPRSTPIPPAPSTPSPSPSDQSPLDLIADARSTSIAELRGEMLKELRRLREIFKEE